MTTETDHIEELGLQLMECLNKARKPMDISLAALLSVLLHGAEQSGLSDKEILGWIEQVIKQEEE